MFEEDDEFKLPDGVAAKHELATELWLEYFNKETPREKRKLIRERYNLVAKAANKEQNHASLQILTESTQWIPKPEPKEPAKKPVAAPTKATTDSKPVKSTTSSPHANYKEPQTGKIAQLLSLFKQGVSKKDLIEKHGFNKSTVNRQVGEYLKAQKGVQQ